MYNFGSINSGSCLGIPFKILGQDVVSVKVTIGHYDSNYDFVTEAGPFVEWELYHLDDYDIIYIDAQYTIDVTESIDKFVYIQAETQDDKTFIIDGKFHIEPLPFVVEGR